MKVNKNIVKKNGFTLVELLAVIAILVIIMLIALPNLSSSIERKENKSLELVKGTVETAGALYYQSNPEVCYIAVQTLIDEDYLDVDDVKKFKDGYVVYNSTTKEFEYTDEEPTDGATCPSFGKKEYVVKYDGNGATNGSMEDSKIIYLQQFVTRRNTFAKTGYSFDCWNEKEDGTGKAWSLTSDGVYENGNGENKIKWTYKKNITLYARWKANTYTVKYDGNGATSGSMEDSKATYDVNFKTIKNKFAKTGYTFDGWNEKSDGTGKKWTLATEGVYESEKDWKWNYTNDLTLYAQWVASKYNVTLDAYGGSVTPASIEVTYDGNYGTLPAAARTGYAFAGWYTDKTNGTKITNDTKVTITSNQTLYAHWTANSYSINYVLNNGSYGSNHPSTATFDKVITINNPSKTVKVTGNVNGSGASVGGAQNKAQIFAGWTPSNWDANTAYYGTSSTNVTIKWDNSSTKVSVDYFKNLTSGTGTVTLTANWTPVAMTLPTVTKTGHTCAWYNTSGTSGGSKVGDSGGAYTPSATSSATITVYARCTPIPYTLTYNANGGSVSPASKTINYNDEYGDFPTPTREGYVFTGWYTTATGNTKATTTTKITKDTTIFAHWSPIYLKEGTSRGATSNYLGTSIKKGEIRSIVFKNSISGHTVNGTNCWDVSSTQSKDVLLWVESTTEVDGTTYYNIAIGQNGGVVANPNSSYLFSNLYNMISINFTNFNTNNVINMQGLFYYCELISSLNLSNFNTSNVTNMAELFYNCKALTSLNFSSFNTSKVTDMEEMFGGCRNLVSLNLSNFNTSNVTNMSFMFYNCDSLTSLNVSNFDTSKVTDMSYMFNYDILFTSLNLSNFNTSKVTNMESMFGHCKNLVSLNLSNFNTSNVTNMSNMFLLCYNLTSVNVSSFNTSKVTRMNGMFQNCESLTSLNLSSFDTSNVTNMTCMFYECKVLTTLDLHNFNISNVTSSLNSFTGIKTNCKITVKSTTMKNWILSKNSSLTNIVIA